MVYASFGFLALLLHPIVNLEVFRTQKAKDSLAGDYYKKFHICVIIYYISDVLWGLLYQNRLTSVVYVDTMVYFASMAFSVYIWSCYVTAYLDIHSLFSSFLKVTGRLIMAFEAVSLAVNLFSPVFFGFGKNGEYIPGPARYITLIIQIMLFIATSAYSVFVSSKTVGKARLHHIAIAISGLVMTLFIVLQTMDAFVPYYAIGCLLASCIMHTFVEEDNRIDHALEVGAATQAQKELEERLKYQEEKLLQEIQKHQSEAMITAMAAEYESVYYIDLDKDEGICYRIKDDQNEWVSEGVPFSYTMINEKYAETAVSDEDRERFLEFTSVDKIRERLLSEPVVHLRYLCRSGNIERYEMLHISRVSRPEETGEDRINEVGMAFSDIDDEARNYIRINKALSDALDQAEEANAAKTSFLSSMSHEIRTPMNAIMGFNTLALKDPDISDSTREYLEKIDSSTRHLLGLINDILDMSRIESGSVTLKEEEFSFREMLSQINTMIQGQCQEKKLDYNFTIKGSIEDYYIGDDTKLRQVLINILGNAIKYTPAPGEVSLEVEQTSRFDRNAVLRFVIRDTGIGMDESFIPTIFNTFSRENESVDTTYGSTGLGMAITKNIVEMMNGRILVESKKGAGSVFTVTVTLKTADRADGDEESKESTLTKKKVSLEGRHILLAEDMQINAEIMKQLLKMHSINVDLAQNGQICVDMFRSNPPFTYDAILMDIRMPVLDGLGATEAIRLTDREDAKVIPIIAMTANAFDEDVQRSLQAGMDAHLTKPVDAVLLIETLEKFIKDPK